MEVLIRLIGADEHMYTNYMDAMQWLEHTDVLEMIVDKFSSSDSPEVHANAAETLCAITRYAPPWLAAKISSPSFVERLFRHALEDSRPKSVLVHSLSVCISLLDPKRFTSNPYHAFRGQMTHGSSITASPETVDGMLESLGDLLKLLDVSSAEIVLPTTYGKLQPPLGKHRLKTVEFISVLLMIGNEAAEKQLIQLGAIQRILDLFFEYPFNNSLHHHVESIIGSCLESKNNTIVDHLFRDCDLIEKILQADRHPFLSGDASLPTLPVPGRQSPRIGNLGHTTRIANKLVQLGNSNEHIQAYLQEKDEWADWQANVLNERIIVENVYKWACGRPTSLQERTRDSDEDELHDRDYDVAALANNLSQAFRYNMYENEDAEEVHGSLERDDEDAYFDDESAEVVISSLRLGDDPESCLFTNSNWFAFQEDRTTTEPLSTSISERMDDINLNGTANGGSSSSDDEVVVGEEEELVDTATSVNGVSESSTNFVNGATENGLPNGRDLKLHDEQSPSLGKVASDSEDLFFFQCETTDNEDLFGDRPLPDWVGWRESSDFPVGGSDGNPYKDNDVHNIDRSGPTEVTVASDNPPSNGEVRVPNGLVSVSDSGDNLASRGPVPSLFEEDVEFVGVELEGTERAMEQALKEGIVGEAGPLKRNLPAKMSEKEKAGDDAGLLEFNDKNYWRVDQEVAVVQE
eukprot:TRINITY_DN1961_c0_g2_i1.p1 TRINITY_DN1961_c0_g2~~TRINITY_DN1961_c0_g2_i1.p1  ORF type:complete len:707 (+),score=143.52 TRINITY_DN1961_c0_g2_i1:46-2121(+)